MGRGAGIGAAHSEPVTAPGRVPGFSSQRDLEHAPRLQGPQEPPPAKGGLESLLGGCVLRRKRENLTNVSDSCPAPSRCSLLHGYCYPNLRAKAGVPTAAARTDGHPPAAHPSLVPGSSSPPMATHSEVHPVNRMDPQVRLSESQLYYFMSVTLTS